MWIGIVAVVVILLVPFFLYNSLVGHKNNVEQAFSAIDVQLKKRFDLIPNLISTVKEYMNHERGTLENITKLRAQAMNPNVSGDEKVKITNELSRSMGGIMVAVENYPDLKANQNFLELQSSLNEVESQLSAARRSYNAAVTAYNNAVEMFPTNIMAGFMSYQTKEVLETPEQERKNPNVKDLFNS